MHTSQSFAYYAAKLFVPIKDLAIDTTSNKPSFEAKPGDEFSLEGHKFFYKSNTVLEDGMYLASLFAINDGTSQKDRLKMIKNFRSNYSSLLEHVQILNNNDSDCVLDKVFAEPNSDERLVEMIIQGPGALAITHHKDKIFKIDLSGMEKYEVREGFIPYGGCLYFTSAYEPLSITYFGVTSVRGDENWEKYKFIFKSSLLTKLIIKTHALEYHLIHGSTVPQALFKLPDNNIVKILMQPFTYLNLESAAAAKTVLFGENRYFHRLFAFTFDSLE